MDDILQPDAFATPGLPPGRAIELPGRGTTFVREAEGPAGAPTLVLLHGWTVNSALNWFAAYEPLSAHFRVLGLDHRGHANGVRSRKWFTLEDCADDAVALLDVLGVDDAVMVGYSMGGPVAQLTWHRHPDRVSGLVLCATAARFRVGRADRALRGMVTGLSYAARATPTWLHRQVTERMLLSRYDATPLGRWAREQSRDNDLRVMIEAGRALGTYDARDWIGGIDVPTAVVLTRFDTTVAPASQQAMADGVPGARVFPVSGGHDVCAVDPDEFVPVAVEACLDVSERARGRDRHPG